MLGLPLLAQRIGVDAQAAVLGAGLLELGAQALDVIGVGGGDAADFLAILAEGVDLNARRAASTRPPLGLGAREVRFALDGPSAVKARSCRVTGDSEILVARFGPAGGGIEAVAVDSKLVTDA